MGAIWLALPQLLELRGPCPPRLLVALLIGAVVLAARPKLFPVVLLVIALVGILELVGWVLKPPPKSRRRGPKSGKKS